MNIRDYKEVIEKTAIYPREVNSFGIAYTYFGMMGEFKEYEESLIAKNKKNIFKEAGDVFWYVTAFCTETQLSIEKIYNDSLLQKHNYIPLKKVKDSFLSFSEDIKKFYRDNKPLNLDKAYTLINNLLISLMNFFSEEEIENILKINYEKLIKRRETNTLHGDGDHREDIN